jgi:uncharacterized sulfatase
MEHPKELDGINVLDETELENREAVFGEIYAHDFNTIEGSLFYRMAMTNPYKLILPDETNKPDEKTQLFNIYDDPFEKENLAVDLPQIVEDLKKKIEAAWQQ